jgi:hypothetical protein
MERVSQIDRAGYSADFIIALNAILFWSGFRVVEVVGREKASWLVKCKLCQGKGCQACHGNGRLVKKGRPHPGLLKDDLWIETLDGEEYLTVKSVGENVLKHGDRQGPVYMHLRQPFVDKIVQRWRETKPGHRVFPITVITAWRICKRMDTIDTYMIAEGRYAEGLAKRQAEKYAKKD